MALGKFQVADSQFRKSSNGPPQRCSRACARVTPRCSALGARGASHAGPVSSALLTGSSASSTCCGALAIASRSTCWPIRMSLAQLSHRTPSGGTETARAQYTASAANAASGDSE
eukprot:CAMPEP_0202036252 /NCGR_PEP_ID=MMETSP0962-20130828/1429_1 /ASSEMBLY_ACC=CAM_ASM_000488 /TAXON_ID=4773 /ORGANISM="Schizochytrium aggregatum, Strain ATCC28209" /LENGTH=114 /DNA_ID=CAMNT_0048600321 /DNA_START=683 /DNA_END=1024 /DNA_ORIENTATION=-